MCHPDTSIVTTDWMSPEWRTPWPNSRVDHTCADWDGLTLLYYLGLSFPMVDGAIETISHGPGMHIVWPSE
ncbi:uncharacterized protein PG986_010093 [Apiospora aurea]|uniref:Uncharacterized protein n=1 Tax=Apiospora aurea TaxID=335848 RepID=A0ABR1Q9J4_9PEZI